jgi:hypothetical protein
MIQFVKAALKCLIVSSVLLLTCAMNVLLVIGSMLILRGAKNAGILWISVTSARARISV